MFYRLQLVCTPRYMNSGSYHQCCDKTAHNDAFPKCIRQHLHKVAKEMASHIGSILSDAL